MSLSGWSNTNRISGTALFASGSERPMSFSCWLKGASGTADALGYTHWLFSAFDVDGGTLQISVTSSGTLMYFQSASNVTSTSFTQDTNWHHLGLSWDSSGNLAFYRDGAANGTGSSAIGGTASGSSLIGGFPRYTIATQGALAEIGVWNRVLTASEFAALGTGYSPRCFPGGLIAAPSLVRSAVQDPISNRWTLGGSLTVDAHARVIAPPQRRVKRYATIPGGTTVPMFDGGMLVGGLCEMAGGLS